VLVIREAVARRPLPCQLFRQHRSRTDLST
jgi:hypothetical protein